MARSDGTVHRARARGAVLLAGIALGASLLGIDAVQARAPAWGPAGAPAGRAATPATLSTAAAPNASSGGIARASPDRTATASAGQSAGLADNGLRSPECGSGGLGGAASQDCRVTRLAFAPAPIDHYAFDIHIDTSITSSDLLLAALQDVLLTPAWTALVWLIHAVLVALEWCYSIDLLDTATAGPVARALRSTQHLFTDPWMATALTVAGILAAYRGLVRRKVAETVAEAALMLCMVALGLWLIANPAATIGRLHREVNAAGLGALAVIGTGTPDQARHTFAAGLDGLFRTAVRGPWCYLEFGDVGWCREPGRLDVRLAAAARRIAAAGPIAISCSTATIDGLVQCSRAASDPVEAGRQVALLRRARTNGDIFLAFPGSSPMRNSISTAGSLLPVLCGATDIAACKGPTASKARFRTGTGTGPRVGGLLFIGVGAAGLILLFSFLALRLLGATLLAVFYLLLAPVAVLSPALGDGGRTAFRNWASRLIGALMAKLLYSVYLGAVLLMVQLLEGMGTLGWWTQWLVVAAFWWLAFLHRHALLDMASASRSGAGHSRSHVAQGVLAARAASRIAAGPLRTGYSALKRASATSVAPAPSRLPMPRPPRGENPEVRSARHALSALEDRRASQVERLLEREHAERVLAATAQAAGATPGASTRAAALRDQQRRARAAGDRRTEVTSALRAQRLEGADLTAQQAAAADRIRLARGIDSHKRTGLVHDGEDRAQAATWLDEQARRRRGIPAGPRSRANGGPFRDYRRLASLAGIGPGEYGRLEPGRQREVRLEIDRELLTRQVQAPGAPLGRIQGWSRHRPRAAAVDASAGGDLSLVPRVRPFISGRRRQFSSVARGPTAPAPATFARPHRPPPAPPREDRVPPGR